jgi:hypothetical protein
MIMNGALLLLVRSVSMALLAMVGGQWVLVYLVSDMSLYFVYKLLRRDLWHWVALEGAASVVESVLERLIVKVLVDFTGVIQFRGAAEMGGIFFTLNMVRASERASEASAKKLLSGARWCERVYKATHAHYAGRGGSSGGLPPTTPSLARSRRPTPLPPPPPPPPPPPSLALAPSNSLLRSRRSWRSLPRSLPPTSTT